MFQNTVATGHVFLCSPCSPTIKNNLINKNVVWQSHHNFAKASMVRHNYHKHLPEPIPLSAYPLLVVFARTGFE